MKATRSPRPPLVARYVGYTKGTENHGDEALIWIIRDLLAPNIRVIVQDEEPYDIALLGGGTLINQSPWLIDQFEQALDHSRTGRGLVFGAGVGDLAFWGNHFSRWMPLLERCDRIGVRGPHSLELLQQQDVRGAEVIGDPYLWLRPPVVRDFVPRHMGVNLGGTNDSLWGGNEADFLTFLTEVLRRLKAEDWTFEWISVWSRDLPLLEKVRLAVEPSSPPVMDARVQPLECYSALARCELFIGEKLHACAMAAVAGTPFISLEYQPKVRDFAASVNMEEWSVSTARRDPGFLVEQVLRLSASRQRMRQELQTQIGQIQNRLARFAQLAGRTLA